MSEVTEIVYFAGITILSVELYVAFILSIPFSDIIAFFTVLVVVPDEEQ
jgi:hypothetical protein